MSAYSVVGRPLARVDGKIKVTGQAQFAGDISLPNMLHGKILRSPYPHARIVRINTSKAEALPMPSPAAVIIATLSLSLILQFSLSLRS